MGVMSFSVPGSNVPDHSVVFVRSDGAHPNAPLAHLAGIPRSERQWSWSWDTPASHMAVARTSADLTTLLMTIVLPCDNGNRHEADRNSAKDTCAPMQRACNLHRKRLSGGMQLQERVTGDVPRAEPNGDPASRRD